MEYLLEAIIALVVLIGGGYVLRKDLARTRVQKKGREVGRDTDRRESYVDETLGRVKQLEEDIKEREHEDHDDSADSASDRLRRRFGG